MNQETATKIIKMTLISAVVCFLNVTNSQAKETADMFSYQASDESFSQDFIQSNVEGLFEGSKIQKSLSNDVLFELVQLKSLAKQFDVDHSETVESSTRFDFHFSNHMFSRIQMGTMRQDVDAFNEKFNVDQNNQKMYSFVQGWEQNLANNFRIESYTGIVRCSDSVMNAQKFYPIFGAKLTKNFGTYAQLQVHAAQEIQSGGSFTGMYGNQIFRKLMVTATIPLLQKLAFIWNAGIGYTESSFSEKGFSPSANVATMGASFNYGIGKNVSGSIGYARRSLMDQSGFGTDGHTMTASLSFANF